MRQSFFAAGVPSTGEVCATLCQCRNVRIERIVSSAHPDPVLYQQPHDEWVLLVAGEAVLRVEDREMTLGPGDSVFIPAGQKHQVLRTTAGTHWLTVHID